MSAYIKLSTLEYPRHAGDIQLDPARDSDYAVVQWVDQPAFNPQTQRCGEGAPVQVDGQWRMTWIVRSATAQEIERANKPFHERFSV